MENWFTIDKIDKDSYIISEYNHWEESHCYLLNGSKRSLLIDTGLGIKNIYDIVKSLTDKPITAVATHIHWDHIGGHEYFPDFYVHEDETDWLNGQFPLSLDQIKDLVVEDCKLPEDFNIDSYKFFQGTATKVLRDSDIIDIGGRFIKVLHTPGHSPGHMCFYEEDKGYLFTGDLVYIGTLFAYFPSTDPIAYLQSIEKISALSVQRIFPAHHELDIPVSIINEINIAFNKLKKQEKLKHGSGTFEFGIFSIKL